MAEITKGIFEWMMLNYTNGKARNSPVGERIKEISVQLETLMQTY